MAEYGSESSVQKFLSAMPGLALLSAIIGSAVWAFSNCGTDEAVDTGLIPEYHILNLLARLYATLRKI